jgi:ABC-2 type transport system permease protein
VIPLVTLLGLVLTTVIDLGPGRRVDVALPGVACLAVLSTAFTGQAIMTGFDRRYGALKRLGATPLPRWGLVAAKSGAVLIIEAGQLILLGVVAARLGWRPVAGLSTLGPVVVALLVGTAAFTGLGLLMAGTLRAEATLAGANLLWLILVAGGGIVVPLGQLPPGAARILGALPSAALTEALRGGLAGGWAAGPLLVLTGWAVTASAAASATFRWE